MPLAAGSKLGSYEILAPIGAGGMGEVYRARDTRLGRDVAIKVLPAELWADERRRRRFVQEARAASALNHPNIVTIHEIESAQGIDFIVMEYLPGRTLEALVRTRMRLSVALEVATQIAGALARAHAAGIVHRDLKPANVMVSDEGVVKVLDFGLAKLVAEPESSEAPQAQTQTTESALTRPGAIAGTPGYMSPEQATGGKVDSRTDVFSFGALLYEMVTARRAFDGGSVAETLAKVIGEEPVAPRQLSGDLPSELEKLIQRCLRKEPERRLQHMGDVKVLLDEISDESASRAAIARPAARARSRWVAAAFVAAVVGAAGLQAWRGRTGLPPQRLVPITTMAGTESFPTFSPDGSQVAFSWEGERPSQGATPDRDIWLKLVTGTETRRLTSGPGDDWNPSWSPDGTQVAFVRFASGNLFSDGTLHVVSVLGGADRRLGEFKAAFSQLSWSPDGRWLAARAAPTEAAPEASGIQLVPVAGGVPRALTTPSRPGYDVHPAFSPDGRRLAYAACVGQVIPPCYVQLLDLDEGLSPRSAPRRLSRNRGAIHGIAWSRDGGSVIYATSAMYFNGRGMGSHLWRVASDGHSPPERIELAPEGSFAPATIPSRDRLVFAQDHSDFDIYAYEPGRGARPVMASSFVDYGPRLSPDGRRIAFESSRSGETRDIWLADPDGSNPVQLTHATDPPRQDGAPGWSPDGRRIVFNGLVTGGNMGLWIIDSDGGSSRRLTEGGPSEGLAVWSRDGRWIYFREDRPEGQDIARIPAAGGPRERLTKTGRFIMVEESPDGKSIFYTRREGTGPLFNLTLGGGPERQVEECVFSRALASTPSGLYYIGCADGPQAPLYRLDITSGQRRHVGQLERGQGVVMGLTVSADGKTILYGREVPWSSDLMMIENFR